MGGVVLRVRWSDGRRCAPRCPAPRPDPGRRHGAAGQLRRGAGHTRRGRSGDLAQQPESAGVRSSSARPRTPGFSSTTSPGALCRRCCHRMRLTSRGDDPPTPGGINLDPDKPCADSVSRETFGRFNNVDIAYGVRLGSDPHSDRADVAVVSDRGCDRVRFYKIDPSGSGRPARRRHRTKRAARLPLPVRAAVGPAAVGGGRGMARQPGGRSEHGLRPDRVAGRRQRHLRVRARARTGASASNRRRARRQTDISPDSDLPVQNDVPTPGREWRALRLDAVPRGRPRGTAIRGHRLRSDQSDALRRLRNDWFV